jgi:hypothetical protein
MTPDTSGRATVFELTIAGEVGPVLRQAMSPHRVVRSDLCTILRARSDAVGDLEGLLLVLQQRGLTVEGMFAVEG